MTSITFGGGPRLEARKAFTNLKPGSQVPGYTGYIHQYKYNTGHTYGEQTHLLASMQQRSKSFADLRSNGNGEPALFMSIQATLVNELPKPNGVNKLTESMMPGYTGYIPHRKYKLSDTYRNECDSCIDNFLTEKRAETNKKNQLVQSIESQPRMNPISTGQDLKEKLATVDYTKHILDRRQFTEAPIPGYRGYIPKLPPTDIGLGLRYHEASERSLNAFKDDYIRAQTASSNPNFRSFQLNSDARDRLPAQSAVGPRRTFVKPGMLPKYTGHVHGFKYDIGKTYGNATRDLPVCYHKYPNFGVYIEKNPNKTVVC